MRKCESDFNTDMLFDWTGDFDFKGEKKKMGNEKTHERQLFQGVGGWVSNDIKLQTSKPQQLKLETIKGMKSSLSSSEI